MNKKAPFFVGYFPVPKALQMFLIIVALSFVAAWVSLGFIIGATQDNPGNGAFRFDYGRQTVTGIVDMNPYPLLHVTKGNDRIKPGHSLMLSGSGKSGVMRRVSKLDGQLAKISGIILQRGSIDMLQVASRSKALVQVAGNAPDIPLEDLGRWKLAGEICDGKCLVGAMRPGRGLAHKACANLCITGGVPPVFVTSQPVEGNEFLLMGSADGGEISPVLLDHVGAYITVEGRVERRGDILIFLVDDETIEELG